MQTLYDVQQLLKQFGIFVYVGSRKYDIEMMAIELKNIYDAGLCDLPTYQKARLILNREHRIEEERESEEANYGKKINRN